MPASFRRLFIANRGEVAVRIAKACDELGIVPVFAVSEADRDASYVRHREVVVLGPARSSQSYLEVARVVQAAVQTRCTALHPGWGFLSENPLLASLCEQHGITFIGPPAAAIALMGKKTPAKRAMAAAGLTMIPGSDGPVASAEEAVRIADEVGYPILLKAESGGGGRGMRIARAQAEVATALAEAQSEARAAFGDDRVYLERLIEGGRHIEVQIMADKYGHAIHVGERDCTVQRNHQKLIEESPSPVLDESLRRTTCELAAAAAAKIGYVGAGTMEFLLDQDAIGPSGHRGVLRFMEMNTRLQVEHPVSELRAGLDLVKLQIVVAAGHRLPMAQADLVLAGHAIECRINAEDPAANFAPSPGRITRWEVPSLPGARFDTHVASGYEVPPHYDSLICKAIAYGATREAARQTMIAALQALVCEGIATTVPMHLAILRSPAFTENNYDTRRIPGWP